MPSTDGVAPDQIRHLELLHASVMKFVGMSFIARLVAVVVMAVSIALTAVEHEPGVTLAALVAAVFLWGLDAACMRSARLYEQLHDDIRQGDGTEPFATVRIGDHWAIPWASFWSNQLVSLYAPLMTVSVIAALIAGS